MSKLLSEFLIFVSFVAVNANSDENQGSNDGTHDSSDIARGFKKAFVQLHFILES
jgi:hypothetical protein